MNNIAIINYGMGNLDSIRRASEECGANVKIASTGADLEGASHIILPGVGAFAAGMNQLESRNILPSLNDLVINRKIPFLGICLGMQLLAESGTEGGTSAGLGWIKGSVKRMIIQNEDERLPHVGWDEVSYRQPSALFDNVPENSNFYFVHSYHLLCEEEQDIIAYTDYCDGVVSGVRKNNVFGLQFHPEKSQKAGFQVLRNFFAY